MLVSRQMDIYGAWLHVVTTSKSWDKLRRRTLAGLPELKGLGMACREGADDGAIHLAVFIDVPHLRSYTAGLVEIVAHESFHAAGMLLDQIGQEYDGESEAMAYLVGFIAGSVWEAVAA